MVIQGKIVDVKNQEIFPGILEIENGKIIKIERAEGDTGNYILPGLVNSHVHIESSMLTPQRFAEIAVQHGTVAAVCDPHEIANVLGEEGVLFMVENGKKSKFKFFFGVPSCVPATSFESSGAILDSKAVEKLLQRDDLYFLAEMMNFPGVIYDDPEVMAKIAAAKKLGKRIDGHAPGLRGDALTKYIEAGVETDHEAMELEEAEEKIKKGMRILIREGSAAKNFEALYPLIDKYPDKVMLCTDDSHPDDLISWHVNEIVKRALAKGLDKFNVLRAATVNAVEFYGLNVGLLQENDPADFIIIDDLGNFNVLSTYINGEKVFHKKTNYVVKHKDKAEKINKFNATKISEEDLRVKYPGGKLRVIKAFDKQLYTDEIVMEPRISGNYVITDVKRDILKIVVLNRYTPESKPAIGFITGFGLKRGAIASTIAHDSHNIIAIGCSDTEITDAINTLIDIKGGIVVNDGMGKIEKIPLDIAGLLTDQDAYTVAEKYKRLKELVKTLGSNLNSPMMTLSFMALPVIPKLKMTDKGLFNAQTFKPVDLFIS